MKINLEIVIQRAAEVRKLEEIGGSSHMLTSLLAVAYAFAGKKRETIEIQSALKEKRKRDFVHPFALPPRVWRRRASLIDAPRSRNSRPALPTEVPLRL